jgi:hypothetical protein
MRGELAARIEKSSDSQVARARKSCYSLFLRLKSYPEITSPTENYEQTPQIR